VEALATSQHLPRLASLDLSRNPFDKRRWPCKELLARLGDRVHF
jgi:hypothetical protein